MPFRQVEPKASTLDKKNGPPHQALGRCNPLRLQNSLSITQLMIISDKYQRKPCLKVIYANVHMAASFSLVDTADLTRRFFLEYECLMSDQGGFLGLLDILTREGLCYSRILKPPLAPLSSEKEGQGLVSFPPSPFSPHGFCFPFLCPNALVL